MLHFSMFLIEFFWTVFFLALFSLLGGFIILPFRQKIFSALLAAPLTGVLVTALGIAGFYSVLALPFWLAATLTLVIFSVLTIISVVIIKPWAFKINYSLSIFVLCVILLLTYLMNYTSIYFGHHGFLFMDGTDQLGYAQIADWIRLHKATHPPITNPNIPYQSWSAHCFKIDNRFGSYYLLTFISWIQQQSGMFAYDSASGIVLIAGILAVCAVYARSTRAFMLLMLALATCHWFELSRSGFFGKIIGYPSIIFLVGLYFHSIKQIEFFTVTLLVILTCAISICYPGEVTALILVLTASIYFLTEILCSKEKYFHVKLYKKNNIFFLTTILTITAIAASGVLSLPIISYFPITQEGWSSLWQALFETTPTIIFIFGVLILLITLFLSVIKKNIIAIALLFSPVILLCMLWCFQANSVAYELIGMFFPFILVGSIWLLDDLFFEHYKRAQLFFYIIIFLIAIHIPKFIQAAGHYSGSRAHSLQFSKPEMNALAKKMDGHHVIINIDDTMHTLPILIDFGYRPIHLEWTAQAWKSIVGYQPWPAPAIIKTHYHVMLLTHPIPSTCKVIGKTNQYQLLFCEHFRER